MDLFTHPDFDDHEQIVWAHDAASGLRAIIAVHSTARGPALGGCRIWNYASEAAAVTDVLRLSRGMTYKAALADLPLGGGKSVILADAGTDKSPAMMQAMGRAIQRLSGRYIAAEDVGATVADMDDIARETSHVTGTSAGSGDPSPWTARGVFLAMEAAAQHRWGTDLAGHSVSVSGLGNVGRRLCRMLHEAGARLFVSDINEAAVERVVSETGARVCKPHRAHAARAEIFAPCALGGALDRHSIAELQAQIVCGAANNQLATPEDGVRLAKKGVLYAPDYVVNAGGLIAVAQTALDMDDADARARLKAIPTTLQEVFALAEQDGLSPDKAADAIALARLAPAPEAHTVHRASA